MKLIAGLLAILLLGVLVSSLPISEAGKGIRMVGTMRDNGEVLLVVQNASANDVSRLVIESFNGDITGISSNWNSEQESDSIDMYSHDKPVRSKSSMRFSIIVDSEQPDLKFKWWGYDSEGNYIARGAFKIHNKLVATEQPITGWIKPITKEDIAAKYGDKYPTPRSDNGDSITQFGYIWDKDPLAINIIIAKNMQRNDNEYKFAATITEAIEEWQYKLRKASKNEEVWGFDIKTFYQDKDEMPKDKADITFNVKSGNYLEYLGSAPCYTPAYIEYLAEQESDPYSNTYGKRGEGIKSKAEFKEWYAEFHKKYEHGNIEYCKVDLEIFMASYVFTNNSFSIVPAGKLSPTAFKYVVKHEFGHVLGLGHTIHGPSTATNMDIMSDGYQANASGWKPKLDFENYISRQDIDALLTIYGTDGFGNENNNNHPLKDPCILTINC